MWFNRSGQTTICTKGMFPVEDKINEILEKLKRAYMDFFSKPEKTLSEAEKRFKEPLNEATAELISACYERMDEALRTDKLKLRESGLGVVRKNDPREILTAFGTVRYRRTYFRMKSGEYIYPTDSVAGVEPYRRLSDGVSEALVEASRSVSYAKSAQSAARGQVSPQSVMRKIRECSVPDTPETEDKPKPATLHLDADEDHITLRGGKKAVVPLVSVYEGIEKRGKRGICRNVFHIARYGEKTEELWEEVLTEMEKRYDLSETKLYLHGDGANWIRAGLKFLPNCVFVLDPYHRKKALRQAVGGLEEKKAEECRTALYEALKNGEKERFTFLAETLRQTQTAKSAKEALKYLRNQFDAIHIRFIDPETRNGGATEAHISHILSSRLSSRPRAWSEETLRHFVPVLASGRFLLKKEEDDSPQNPPKPAKRKKKKKTVPFSLGLPDPDRAVSLPARSGKVTPLFNALRPF